MKEIFLNPSPQVLGKVISDNPEENISNNFF